MNNKFLFLLARTFLVAAGLFILIWAVLRFSPYPQLRIFMERPNSVRYYDRNGLLLQITPLDGGLRREVPLEMPAQVKDVFVFSEDKRFYRHAGVDMFSLARAMFQNITQGRRVSGASTITMQLARIIEDNARSGWLPPRRQTLVQKIAEMINAFRLETRLSKEEILELYLISLPFGYNTEGVASAARTFFASDISMLSPAKIFCLAVIPRRPSLYNPIDNPETCIAAARGLHSRFSADKKLKNAWPLLAQADEQDFLFSVSGARRFDYPFELPHLIRHVSAENIAAGIKAKEIHLSIDLELQHFLEGAVAGNVARFYYSRLTNGAALVIDNVTGEILAWVGSSDFFHAEASGQIDGVLALNQAGSSMKQFLYAMALDHGFKPTHILADIQMTFGRSEVYIPRNFNDRFNGPLLLRTALASSLNIPAVYLLYRLGVRNYTELLFTLGFDSLEHSAEDAGLGLILGNAPVSLLELVRAFSVFPRDGLYIPVTWELKTDQSEEILGVQVFSVDSSRIILSFLSDTGARVIAFGPGRNFRTSFPSIFKTGTANQFQSIVALGASQRYTAGVWMGNFTGETVIGRTGSSVPAAITRDTLVFLEERHGMHAPDFPEPENWIIQPVCAASGMEPTEACLAVVGEYVQPQDVRSPCTWHRIVNGRSEAIYPAEYQSWFISRIRQGSLFHASRALEIITPREGFVYLTSPGIGISEVPVEVIGGEGDVLRITHNGNTFHAERPFVFYLPRIPGLNILHVQSENEEAEVTFMVE